MSTFFPGQFPGASRRVRLGDLTSDQLIERRRILVSQIEGGETSGSARIRSILGNELAALDKFAPRLVPEPGAQPGIAGTGQQTALGVLGVLRRRTPRPETAGARGNRLGGSRGNIFKQRLGR